MKALPKRTFFEALRKDLKIEQIISVLHDTSFIPPLIAESVFKYWHEQRKVDIINIPLKPVPAQPEEAILQAYYQENKALFFTPEARSFSYVVCQIPSFQTEIRVNEQEIEEEYQLKKDHYIQDEQRIIELITFSSEEKAKEFFNQFKGDNSLKKAAIGVASSKELPAFSYVNGP